MFTDSEGYEEADERFPAMGSRAPDSRWGGWPETIVG